MPRTQIDSPYYRRGKIIQVPHGFQEDALHLGAGVDDSKNAIERYQIAFQQMQSVLGRASRNDEVESFSERPTFGSSPALQLLNSP